MCGIVGYIGYRNARSVLVDGLRTLEYRGYDSAGVAFGGERLSVFKTAGRVSALEEMLPVGEHALGIGHTRWATHGGPNAINAHPHLSFDGRVAAVHNGVLENCDALRSELLARGVRCVSETDSELIAHLLALELDGGDMLDAVRRVGARLAGAATFLAIAAGEDSVYAYRQGASMLVAEGEGESFAASDGLALAKYCSTAIVLDDGDLARLSRDGVHIFREGRRIQKPSIELRVAPPEECVCHMRSEIDEIPSALKRTFGSVSAALDEDVDDRLRRARRIIVAGCGTAFHACRYFKLLAEGMTGLQVEAIAASEMDGALGVDKDCFAAFVSQSGETADTLLAMKRCRQQGAYTLAVTNVNGSSLSLAADKTLLLEAGAEVAVAATKSYCCQLLALYMLLRHAAGEPMSEVELRRLVEACERANSLEELYEERLRGSKLFLVGRGQDLITAKEGALKFKEITYRQAEAYAAGELKHGPIALIDSQSSVLVLATREEYLPRIRATVSELRSRGAYTVGLSSVGDLGTHKTVELPRLEDASLEPIVSVIPLQNLALATSLCLGLDPDKPRNLAKSVTVI